MHAASIQTHSMASLNSMFNSHTPALCLADLSSGQKATIAHINVAEALVPRIQAMGLKSGVEVQCIRRAPFNGPIHIRIGLTDLIMRKQDAAMLSIVAV